jgi:hypothetical protein
MVVSRDDSVGTARALCRVDFADIESVRALLAAHIC